MYTVWTHDVCDCSSALKIVATQHLRSGVDVVEHAAVDADRCVQLCIFRYEFYRNIFAPMPYRMSCISSFHCVVEVVPMVEDATLI